MEDILKYIKPNWNIRYSEYVDDLILFSDNVNRPNIKYKNLTNDTIVGFLDDLPVYLKIENASRYFNDCIELMQISEVIKNLKEVSYA